MDAYTNFAVSTVATAPSPASSGTSLVVASGHGTRFPAPPFNASVWPADALPTPATAEIVRVTGISTDTLTISRAQESTTARSITVGDLIAATITKQTLDDLVAAGGGGGGTPGATPSTFLVQGGQVAWESAYTFRVSAAEYYINGAHLTSAEGTVTLEAAHATLDRLDVIALDTAGAIVAIAGTAAATPSEPSVDPAAYLKLVIVQVLHATTAPPGVASLLLYAENAGGPTEFGWTSSGASLVLNSTTTPHVGTTAIEGTNVVAGVYAQGTRGAGTIDPNAYDSLVLFLRSKAAWNNNRGLLISLRAAGVLVGAAVQIRRSGTYGFDSALTSAYQMVAIPLIAFAVPQGTLIDQVRVEDFGGAIGFYLDDISLQTGALTGGGGGGLSQEQADARYAPLVHAARHSAAAADAVTVTALAGFPGGTTTFLRADATFAAPGGGGTAFALVFRPQGNEAPATAYATLDTRNGHPVLDFDGATDEEAVFTGVLPAGYAGGGLTVVTWWAFTAATSGNLRVQAAIERVDVSALDLDADSFAAFQSAGGTAPGTSGHVIAVTVTFTAGAQMDSLAAGELFRLKLRRDADGTSGTDDIATDAELVAVLVRET